MEVVPVVNENDTVAVEELRIGDNDTLSAHVASLVNADVLLLLTDVDGLFTDDPRANSTADPIRLVHSIAELESSVNIGSGSKWGTGGMVTKMTAAQLATASG